MKLERLLSLVFGLALCMTLSACGGDTDTDNDATDPTDQSDASDATDASDSSDPSDTGETRAQTILALIGDASSGNATYDTNCSGCHSADGSGGVGTNIQGWTFGEESVNAILDGKGSMPGFGSFFTDQEIADLIAYVETL